ncbi:MAG TPA: outer membrane lipoprotein carrier protein LolA [Thermoanaerobaculia bacterium]
MSIGPYRFRLFAAALCAIAAISVSAAPPVTLPVVIRKMQEQQKKTNTLQAEFRQEKEMALLAKPEVSTGTFTYAKPNNVFWSYDTPKKVQMVIANGALTTYFPDLKKAEKVDVKRFEDRIFRYMGASGAIDELARYFDFTFTNAPSKPEFVLDLKPKTKAVGKRVQKIRIWLDKKSYLTTKIEYVEGDGDVTRYAFTNIRINEPVPASRFTLALPAGVRVEQMKIQ